MSDEHEMQPEEFDVVPFSEYSEESSLEEELDAEYYEEEEYEEIDSAEIDSVVAALNELMEKTQSQTIRDYLEAACSDVACLMEEIDEEDEPETEAA